MSRAATARTEWTNWFTNLSCQPSQLDEPLSEADVQDVVARATRDQRVVRVAGGGHSLSPLVPTTGVLLDLGQMSRWIVPDTSTSRVRVAAGMRLHDLFEPLWEAGLALRNMGDLAAATIAGATSTGVHGTGVELPCVSASVVGLRLVTASGDVVSVSEETPELLRATCLGLGMLGVITELTLQTLPAYQLRESSFITSVADTLDTWDDFLARHRQYSFFYLPRPEAREVFGLENLPGAPSDSSEACYVTLRDVVPAAAPTHASARGEHQDRMYRILAGSFGEPNFREAEFSVPLEQGKAAFTMLRGRLAAEHPSYAYPVEVTFVAQDDALLSPYSDGPRTVFSICEDPDADWVGLFTDMERALAAYGARPHWGKWHSLDRAGLAKGFPQAERFVEIRRELDPSGTFLNQHLAELFA